MRASRRTPIICELPLKFLSNWYAMCQSVTAINMPLEPVPVNLTQQRSVSCSYSHENRAKQFKLETTSRSRFFGSRATPFELVLKRRVKCELCAVNSPRNLKNQGQPPPPIGTIHRTGEPKNRPVSAIDLRAPRQTRATHSGQTRNAKRLGRPKKTFRAPQTTANCRCTFFWHGGNAVDTGRRYFFNKGFYRLCFRTGLQGTAPVVFEAPSAFIRPSADTVSVER